MSMDSIPLLLDKLGCEKISHRRNGWIQSTCPFAPYTAAHKNNRDDHPSFGVGPRRRGVGGLQSDRDEMVLGYKCYTCNTSGLLKWLLVQLEGVSGNNYHHLYRYVQTDRTLQGLQWDPSDKKPSKVIVKPKREPPEITEDSLSRFSSISLVPLKYLIGPKRNLTLRTIQKWGLMWDPVSLRIVIPMRDIDGKLVGYSRRALVDPEVDYLVDEDLPKYLHCAGFPWGVYMFGEHLATQTKTAYIVEGFFDAIYLWQSGYIGAQAVLGASIGRTQVQKLIQRFDKVYTIGDGDAAGRKMTDEVFVKLSTAVECERVHMPDGKDPDNLSPEQLCELLGPPSNEVLDNHAETD